MHSIASSHSATQTGHLGIIEFLNILLEHKIHFTLSERLIYAAGLLLLMTRRNAKPENVEPGKDEAGRENISWGISSSFFFLGKERFLTNRKCFMFLRCCWFISRPYSKTNRPPARTKSYFERSSWRLTKVIKSNLNFRIKLIEAFDWNLKLIRNRFELNTLKQFSNLKYLNVSILSYALSTVNWADEKVIQHNVNLDTSSDIHEAIINIFGGDALGITGEVAGLSLILSALFA